MTTRTSRAGFFAVWALLGALVGLGILATFTPLILLLPLAAVLAGLLLWRRSPGREVLGLVSGLGLMLLVVAWLNRGGPGEVCRDVAGGQECSTQWSPWPWLVLGLVFLVGGAVLARWPVRRPVQTEHGTHPMG